MKKLTTIAAAAALVLAACGSDSGANDSSAPASPDEVIASISDFRSDYSEFYDAELSYEADDLSRVAENSTVVTAGTLTGVEAGPDIVIATDEDTGEPLIRKNMIFRVESGDETYLVVQRQPGALDLDHTAEHAPIGQDVVLFAQPFRFAPEYSAAGAFADEAEAGELLQLSHPSGLMVSVDNSLTPLIDTESEIPASDSNLELISSLGIEADTFLQPSVPVAGDLAQN